MAAKGAKLQVREKPTERRLAWQIKSARGRKALRDAERQQDPKKVQALIEKASKLFAEAEALRKKPPANLVERASKIGAWRRDRNKPAPSEALIRWAQEHGQWCAQADGTFNGEARFTVPTREIDTAEGMLPPRSSAEGFAQWFVELTDPLGWLEKEPVFWAVGLSLGGVTHGGSDPADLRYSKIKGQSAWISYWRKPDTELGREFRGGRNTWQQILQTVIAVGKNIIGADLRVTGVTFFMHYGPTPPMREEEFVCEQKVVGTTKAFKPRGPRTPKQVPGKKVLPKRPKRYGFVVYDENARRYLNQKAYSYRPGLWGSLADAFIFDTRAKAQSAASNLNAKRPKARKYRAVVWPVELPA